MTGTMVLTNSDDLSIIEIIQLKHYIIKINKLVKVIDTRSIEKKIKEIYRYYKPDKLESIIELVGWAKPGCGVMSTIKLRGITGPIESMLYTLPISHTLIWITPKQWKDKFNIGKDKYEVLNHILLKDKQIIKDITQKEQRVSLSESYLISIYNQRK